MRFWIVVVVMTLRIGAATMLQADPAAQDATYKLTLIHIQAYTEGDASIDDKLSDIKADLEKMKQYKKFVQWDERDGKSVKTNESLTCSREGLQFTITPTGESDGKVHLKVVITQDDKELVSTTANLKREDGVFFQKINLAGKDFTYLAALKVK